MVQPPRHIAGAAHGVVVDLPIKKKSRRKRVSKRSRPIFGQWHCRPVGQMARSLREFLVLVRGIEEVLNRMIIRDDLQDEVTVRKKRARALRTVGSYPKEIVSRKGEIAAKLRLVKDSVIVEDKDRFTASTHLVSIDKKCPEAVATKEWRENESVRIEVEKAKIALMPILKFLSDEDEKIEVLDALEKYPKKVAETVSYYQTLKLTGEKLGRDVHIPVTQGKDLNLDTLSSRFKRSLLGRLGGDGKGGLVFQYVMPEVKTAEQRRAVKTAIAELRTIRTLLRNAARKLVDEASIEGGKGRIPPVNTKEERVEG